jgi:hypothetical protein
MKFGLLIQKLDHRTLELEATNALRKCRFKITHPVRHSLLARSAAAKQDCMDILHFPRHKPVFAVSLKCRGTLDEDVVALDKHFASVIVERN